MRISLRTLAAHLHLLLHNWLSYACLFFVLIAVFEAPHGGLHCQWQARVPEIVFWAWVMALLFWLPERKRALAGLPPSPRRWWLP